MNDVTGNVVRLVLDGLPVRRFGVQRTGSPFYVLCRTDFQSVDSVCNGLEVGSTFSVRRTSSPLIRSATDWKSVLRFVCDGLPVR